MTEHEHPAGRPKAALRHELRAAVARLSPSVRAAASGAVCRRVRALPQWLAAECVLLFSPLADEPDISPLLAEALVAGKRVALPRFHAGPGAYEAVWITDPQTDLVVGRFGIGEPRAGLGGMSGNRLDLALVPGVGFDRRCCRLGRGKGFFDRLLAGLAGFKCGVAFDEQLVDALPVEPHDVRLNCILTPSHVVTR